MAKPLLPSLNADNKIAITKRGEWQAEAQNELKNLVTDLKVTADNKSSITSIPDLWARPAMYEMVLYDENHHLHNKFLAEWRGILTMLALNELRNFKKLGCVSIEIPEADKVSIDAPNFLKVVSSMLPDEYKEYVDESVAHGHKIQVITYGDAPLAVVWPTILICPAVGLAKQMDRSVPWWNFDGINDPVSSLNEKEKALLIEWLENVKSKQRTDLKGNKLIEILAAFQDDLYADEKATGFALGTGLAITGICNIIGKSILPEIGDNPLECSNVRLLPRRGGNPKTLLVLTEDLNRRLNKKPSDIKIAGNVNFDSAIPYGGVIFDHKKLNNIDLEAYNAELRLGSEFFTEQICLIDAQKDLFPNALKNFKLTYHRVRNVLLPLKKEILDYLPPEYIISHFRMSVADNGTDIKAELDIPLSGFSEDGELVTIEKIYHARTDTDEWKREIVDDLGAPLIQIWPNFIPNRPEDWQAYYSYYDDLSGRTFSAKPLTQNDNVETRHLEYTGGNIAEICKSKTFPEGYACGFTYQTFAGKKYIELGLVLIQAPKKMEFSVNKDCKIGIDFGTTNSVAYISFDNHPHVLRFQDRLYAVTESEDQNSIMELRRHFFTPFEQPNEKFSSMRTQFNPNVGSFNGDVNQPVFPGVVYFLDNIDNLKDDSQIVHNIVQGKEMKWDDENGRGRQYMTYFLMHIGLLSMAEAVANGATRLAWSYSYPKAFNDMQIASMASIWSIMMEKFNLICPNLMSGKPRARTESISMAEFFRSEMNAGGIAKRGLICFDIGGGSTDIAIWQGLDSEIPKGQCSLMLAGNDILNKQLFANRDILLRFTNNDNKFNELLEDLCAVNDEKEFNMRLEAMLKYNEKGLFQSLVSKIANPNVKLFVRNIAFALSGMFYYAGMLLGNLKHEGQIKIDKLPHCFVGGNGSKLLDWVDMGNYQDSSMFEQVYIACFAAGFSTQSSLSREEANFNIRQSLKPKEEVAYGLVCNSSVRSSADSAGGASDLWDPFGGFDDPEDDTEKIFAGAEFIVNGTVSDSVMLSKNDIISGVSFDYDIPMFKRFVKGFNALIAKRSYTDSYQLKFTDADYENIVDQTNDIFAMQEGSDSDKINLEPPFIIMLKEAMEILTKQNID